LTACVVLVLVAGSAAAQDKEKPVVVLPEDVPGADVIIFKGDTYMFDFSQCTDNVGIVSYLIEFEDNGTPVQITTANHTYNYTFANYTQMWVDVTAFDEEGNKGFGQFTIDVAEKITSNLIMADNTYNLDHSLYIDNADLTIDNAVVNFGEGAGKGKAAGGGSASDMWGESMTPDGDFSGHWEPYNYLNNWARGDTYYGRPYADYNTKFSGEMSIMISGSRRYYRGFEYHFDHTMDLSEFNTLTFWLHASYRYYYARMCHIYFFKGDYRYYGYGYMYMPGYQETYFSSYYGWAFRSFVLDWDRIGYNSRYRMNDLTQVDSIRIYWDGYRYARPQWIDHIGLSKVEAFGDEMTESTTPSGDFAGYWRSNGPAPTTSSHSFVGDNSIQFRLNRYWYHHFDYYFNSPVDLSGAQGLRFFTYLSGYRYGYWYAYQMEVYSANGARCYYYNGYCYMNYRSSYYYGRWDHVSTAFGYLYIDGLEFVYPGGGAGGKADMVGLAMYAEGGDVVIKGNSRIVGTAETGARILTNGGTATMYDSTFENIWATNYPGAGNSLDVYGGLEVYGNAVIDNINFVNTPGPGLALFDGIYTLGKDSIDFSGCTQAMKTAPMLILGVTERTKTPYTVDLTGWAFENSPVGTGALVMLKDCTVATTVKVHGNTVSNNAHAGIVVSNVGGSSDLSLEVYSQVIQRCGYGFMYNARGVQPSTPTTVKVDIHDINTRMGGKDGILVSFERVTVPHEVNVRATKSTDNGDSGLVVAPLNMRGDLKVAVNGLTADTNKKDGMRFETGEWTGNQSVEVMNSVLEMNDGSGFSFLAKKTKPLPRTGITVNVHDNNANENGAYGYLVTTDGAIVETNIAFQDLKASENRGTGVGVSVKKTDGNITLTMNQVASLENDGNGMYIQTSQENFKDVTDTDIQADATLNIDMDSCSFSKNEGSGVVEAHQSNAASTTAMRAGTYYRLTGLNITLNDNVGHGYYVGPSGSSNYGFRDAIYQFNDSLFTENSQNGFYIRDFYNNDQERGYTQEVYNFYNCTFRFNRNGLEQYWDSYSYGVETYVNIKECILKDNDVYTLYAHGYWYGWYGRSYLKTANYDVRDSLIDGHVNLDISGAYDQNGVVIPKIEVAFVNNEYVSEQPMFIRLGAYYSMYKNPLYTTLLYENNKHILPSTTDGMHFEFYGGSKLTATVTIRDQKISRPLGNGIKMIFGTLYTSSSQRKSIAARVLMEDVEVDTPFENGIDFEVSHRNLIDARANGVYTLSRVKVKGAEMGIRSEEFDGEIRNCDFRELRDSTIYNYAGIIDVYESEVGEVTMANLRVDEKGAIRLWYSMRVRVVWRDTGKPVIDANVEIKDNTWSIIGINTIGGGSGVHFGNLNAYTSTAEGIFTKNPYIVTVDFLGIVREETFTVTENMDVTIRLVDDISPRLTIETPEDGRKQREHVVHVKGKSFDVHSGIDKVVVSIDEETWYTAEGTETYTYVLEDCPEGAIMVFVRAYDTAGNIKEIAVSIHIDSTPPSLSVITPEDGMRTNKRFLEVVGITDVGSDVYINDRPITIDYTLISHVLVLNEGPNTIKIAVADFLGNVNLVVRTVILDTQAPFIEVISPKEGATIGTSKITLVAKTEPEDVTIEVKGKDVPVDIDGTFETELILEEGVNAIDISGIDGVGNERHITLRVTLDMVPPWIKLIQPVPGETFTSKDVPVNGYVEQGTRVYVNEREVEVVFGQFETFVSTQEGNVVLSVVAIDDAGNEMTLDIPILVDITAPTLEIISPIDGYVTNTKVVLVSGIVTASEVMRDLELFINKVPRLIGPDGRFSQELVLEEGVNLITFEVIDVAGNRMTATRTVILDSEAPYLHMELGNVRIDTDTNEYVSRGTFVYVTGFTEIGAKLLVNGVMVEVDEMTGHFNYSLELLPPVGTNKIHSTLVRVTSTDAAGNMAIEEETVNRIEGVDVDKEEKIKNSEWMVLLFSLIILALAIVGTVAHQRYTTGEELTLETPDEDMAADEEIDIELEEEAS
jgi:hypothetical protein